MADENDATDTRGASPRPRPPAPAHPPAPGGACRPNCFPPSPAPAPPPVSGCSSCVPSDYAKPPEETDFGGFLRVVGPPPANERVLRWLYQLGGTKTGRMLFSELKSAGGKCLVAYWDTGTLLKYAQPAGFQVGKNPGGPWQFNVVNGYGEATRTPGTDHYTRGKKIKMEEGIVTWDWGTFMIPALKAKPLEYQRDARDPAIETPGAACIGHELIHLLHSIRGEDLGGVDTVPGDAQTLLEEARTVGIRDGNNMLYAGEPVSENAIRRDLGAPMRLSYSGPFPNLDNLRWSVETRGWPEKPQTDNFGPTPIRDR